jgi:hypothetical protein
MRTLPLLLALALGTPTLLPAQDGRVHVLIVTGLGGEPAEGRRFVAAGSVVHETARSRWGVADSSLIFLAEQPTDEPGRITGRSTRETISESLLRLSRRVSPGDVLLVLLIGHGSGEGRESRVNLPGPDPAVSEWAAWLDGFSQQTVVMVVAASGSGDMLSVLSGPNRIVMTATKSASERNASIFAGHLAQGLGSGQADADQDGAVSALEAFRFAKAAVARSYEADKKLQTEHAMLDDNGDRLGSAEPGVSPSLDGGLAQRVTFQRRAESTDPRIMALVAERRALEAQLAELRARKATTDSMAYERDLERLLLEIAARTRAIRLIEQGARP